MNLNKVHLIGRITRDPELKSLPSGVQVVGFSLATNRVWKDKNGAKQESTDFHNVVGFGKQAETIGMYVKKGQLLYVDGRLQTRSWDDKESGKKNYRTEIVLETFQFGPKASGTSSKRQENEEDFDEQPKKKASRSDDTIEFPEEEIDPNDIPF